VSNGFSHLYKMKACKLNKKGIGALQSLAIGLLVVGVVLGFLFIFLNTLTADLSSTSATVYNETVTPVNNTPVWLSYNYSSVGCFDTFSIIDVRNDTSGNIINSGNYSTDPAGTITWNGLVAVVDSAEVDVGELGSPWNVTYSYMYDPSSACVGIEDTITGVAKLPAWLGLVVLLVIIGILLALVYKYIQVKGGGEIAEI